MVTLYFSHQSLVGGSTIGMGIKKAQTPSHTLYRALHCPNTTMVEVCAIRHSFNVVLDLLIKSRSRCKFGREIEQQKDLHPFRNACDKDGANRVQRARSLPRCSPLALPSSGATRPIMQACWLSLLCPFSHKFCAKLRTFHENWSRRMLFLVIFTDLII